MGITRRIKNPFGKYKNAHKNESVILYGSGPSIQKFKTSKNVIKIGMNEQIYLDLDLDYWFMGDPRNRQPEKFRKCKKDYDDYRPKIAKFIRWKLGVPRSQKMPYNMPHSTYYLAKYQDFKDTCLYKKNIDEGILPSYKSITDEALQFALFAGFKRIYLVGHDCDYSDGTFRTDKLEVSDDNDAKLLLNMWPLIKEWIGENYPDVEIYSINPVGLKIFKEVREEDIVEN